MVTLSAPAIAANTEGSRVEILGVFGSGKTTLAKRLAGANLSLLAEDHERNPFWGQPEAISALGYLGYDLSFLLQHAHLVVSAQADLLAICDWSFATDRLWASLRLNSDIGAYEAVHKVILQRLAPPDGYLLLRQTPETILDRLEQRSRRAEESFRQYVREACEHLEELASRLPDRKVLVVDDDCEQATVDEYGQLS